MNTNQLERQLYKTQKFLKILEKEKGNFQNQIQDLELKLEKSITETKQTKTQMDETKETLQYLQSSLKYEEDQNIIQYDQLRLLYNAIITIQSRSQNQQDLIEKKNQELESFERSIYELTQENRDLKFKVQDLSEELENERQSNSQIKQNLEDQLVSYKKRLILTVDALCEKENIIQDLSQLWKNVEDLRPKLESLSDQEKEVPFIVEKEVNSGEELQIFTVQLKNKIEELQNELHYYNDQLNLKDNEINSLKEQLENIQNVPQAKIQTELVLQVIPKVFQEKISILKQSQNMLPQFTSKVIAQQSEIDEVQQQNKELKTKIGELQEISTKTEEESEQLKLQISELKTQKAYIIQNAEILLKQNWAMKNELLRLIGHDQTLTLIRQHDSKDQLIEGLNELGSLNELIEENIKLKTQQYQRSTNWFKSI